MSRKRKAGKSKTQRPKPESLMDRRGFVTQVTSGVATALILDGLHHLPVPPEAKITPPEPLSLSVSDSVKVREKVNHSVSPFYGTFKYEVLIGPNAPGGQYHGQVS